MKLAWYLVRVVIYALVTVLVFTVCQRVGLCDDFGRVPMRGALTPNRSFGWVPPAADRPAMRAGEPFAPGPEGAGKTGFLWKFYEKAYGKEYEPRDQGNSGTCVGQSCASGIDFLQAVHIAGLGNLPPPLTRADAGSIYALAKYEVAYLELGIKRATVIEGAGVDWAVKAMLSHGCLAQKSYGSVDLTTFDPSRASSWGRTGLPDDLEPIAKQHCIKGYAQVFTYEQVCTAIYRGYPVVIGSSIGYANQPTRDADGFLEPQGSWNHAMVIVGFDDTYRRPGALILNSWGTKWLTGPRRHGQPEGSFWVSREHVQRMIDDGEAFALIGFTGFRGAVDWSVLD